jgi:hypothetical protein
MMWSEGMFLEAGAALERGWTFACAVICSKSPNQ